MNNTQHERTLTITPTVTQGIQRLQGLFNHTYAHERVNLIINPPTYDITTSNVTKPNHIQHHWDGIFYHDNDPCTSLHFRVNIAQYPNHDYGSWEPLAQLAGSFPLIGKDIMINNDGSVNISGTMKNFNARQRTILITPQNTNNIKTLQNALDTYGHEQVHLTMTPPSAQPYKTGVTPSPYHMDFSWGGTITGQTTGTTINVSFMLENDEYHQHPYSSWMALADLTSTFTVTGNDVVVKYDGSINLTETVKNIFNL